MSVIRRIFDLVLLGALIKTLNLQNGLWEAARTFFALDDVVQAGVLGMTVIVVVTAWETLKAIVTTGARAFVGLRTWLMTINRS
ncbi:hypothetical protein [Brevundimonas aveniformis]|uniref:hypothetical protein n=1 Tax=Brevundimonas aveniformis TaxID=370977 RepID=UPI0003F4D6D2|nr:hypothetical protein [Brevundimonas aveniformis]